MVIDDLKVAITRTANDKLDYIQIMSTDQLSINIVLVANHIDVQDRRIVKEKEEKEVKNDSYNKEA